MVDRKYCWMEMYRDRDNIAGQCDHIEAKADSVDNSTLSTPSCKILSLQDLLIFCRQRGSEKQYPDGILYLRKMNIMPVFIVQAQTYFINEYCFFSISSALFAGKKGDMIALLKF